MAPDFVYDSEMVPLSIAPRKVRRSRCMCLLFLFLIAASVGLVPIMVYRSLGVPLPNRLKGYRNVQPWMIGPAYSSPSSEGVDVQTPLSTPSQDPETTTNLQTTATPKVQS